MEEPTPPARTLSIEFSHEDAAAMEVALPLIMKHHGLPRNEALNRALMLGMVILQQDLAHTLERKHLVTEGIRKLKAAVHVSPEELNAIDQAARSGDIEAQIIVHDFKRFGRSIARD